MDRPFVHQASPARSAMADAHAVMMAPLGVAHHAVMMTCPGAVVRTGRSRGRSQGEKRGSSGKRAAGGGENGLGHGVRYPFLMDDPDCNAGIALRLQTGPIPYLQTFTFLWFFTT